MTDAGDRLPPGLALSWGVQPVPRRGPKPGLSVDRIVTTAIEFGDAHGFETISLQKVATRLGVSTNAMYRYVSSKEELIVLARDRAIGPAPELPAGWREGAMGWVHAMVGRYEERPWLLDVPIRGAPVTPNALHWVEVLLQAFAGAGLSRHDTLGCVLLLDGFARNYGSLVRQLASSGDTPVQAEAVGRFLLPRLTERFPLLAAYYTADEYADEVDDDLTFGLTRILDGIQQLIEQAAGS